MKKHLSSLVLLASVAICAASAQNTTKLPDALLKQMADSACDCLTAHKTENPNATGMECKDAVTSCVNTAVVNRLTDIQKHMSMEELSGQGKTIGVEMAKIMINGCPVFVDYTMKLSQENQQKAASVVSGTTTGKIKGTKGQDFVYFILEDETGRENSFLWLEHFKNSEDLINGIDKVKGKKAKITWVEMECYLPKAKGYYKVKKIQAIEWL